MTAALTRPSRQAGLRQVVREPDVLDSGTAKSLSTSTAQKDIACMFFDQKGLMGGIGLQGSKLSKMKK